MVSIHKNRNKLLGLTTVFVVASIAATYSLIPLKNAHAVGTERFVYVGNYAGNPEVYTMDADGSNKVNLSNSPSSEEYEPYVSPDGSKIVFQTNRDGGSKELYVMNIDGSSPTRLTTNGAGVDREAAWSPDGSKIAFSSNTSGNYEIYVMNADGSNQTKLTNSVGGLDGAAAWSPDGTKIMFDTFASGNNEIFVMDADGSNQTNVTNSVGYDSNQVWSPDGSKIAYDSNVGGDYEIYVMNADGSNKVNISNSASNDYRPHWSPDGNKIAWTTNRVGGIDQIFVMNPDGSSKVNVSNSGQYDTEPRWEPNSSRIAFTSSRSGNSEIYLVNVDGTNEINITNTSGFEFQYEWYVQPSNDTDNDGITNAVEASGPNSGDANNDGIADSQQAYVASFTNSITGKPVVLELPSACTLSNIVVNSEAQLTVVDSGYRYDNGFVRFTASCGTPGITALVKQYYYGVPIDTLIARKHNPSTGAFFTIPQASLTTQSIAGQDATLLSFQVTDGSSLDVDGVVDGNIVDPVGLGVLEVGVPNTGLKRQ